MNLFKIFLFIFFNISIVYSQKNKHNFSQIVLKEDFEKLNKIFPTESKNGNFSVIIDTLGQYFIGSDKSNYSLMLDWNNDLVEYQLETGFEFAPEDKIDIFKKEKPQEFGIILQYNPDNQNALMLQINNDKKFRFIYINNSGRNKVLSSSNEEGWIKTKNIWGHVK